MRVIVIGGTGFTGGNIVRELESRGIEAVALSPHTEPSIDVFDPDALAAAAEGADAIVVAVQPIIDGRPLVDALPGLVAAARGKRLGFVGGASSLRRSVDGPRLIDDDFPEDWRPGAEALIDVKTWLEGSGTEVDWFFLSPPEHYGSYAPGERRGAYRLGTEVVVTEESTGRSHIGGEDYALALVDELVNPQHHRMRFTVGY